MSEQELKDQLIGSETPILRFADGDREYTIWPNARIKSSDGGEIHLLHNGISPLIENAVLRAGEFRQIG